MDNRPLPKKRKSLGIVLLGALILGVIVPCGLTAMHLRDPMLFLLLGVFATIFCGPLAFVFSYLIAHGLRRKCREAATEAHIIKRGIIFGVLVAFFNLPGYLCIPILDDGPFPSDGNMIAARVFALFAVTGATCGGWIGSQVYKIEHDKKGLLPPFSLMGLLGFTMAWGVLLALFVPR